MPFGEEQLVAKVIERMTWRTREYVAAVGQTGRSEPNMHRSGPNRPRTRCAHGPSCSGVHAFQSASVARPDNLQATFGLPAKGVSCASRASPLEPAAIHGQDVANAALYLASDSRFVMASGLVVDGGLIGAPGNLTRSRHRTA